MTIKKERIALLGATGLVGQRMIALLENHNQFEISELVASDKNVGKKYCEASLWHESSAMPETIKNLKMISAEEVACKYALSALPSDIALTVEKGLAERGIHVISNAASYRMHKNVPLIIPEINWNHIELIHAQNTKGKIITNPNCATVFLVAGLWPLMQLGKFRSVNVVTLQALSGAGFPGVSSFDLLGDVIPNIQNEEEKLEIEVHKILGDLNRPTNFPIIAHVNRVPVKHGHTIIMHVEIEKKNLNINLNLNLNGTQKEIIKVIENEFISYETKYPNLYKTHFCDNFGPRPTRDLSYNDNRVHIGRLKVSETSETVTIGLLALGHNLVRGAAGAAIMNLEMFYKNISRE